MRRGKAVLLLLIIVLSTVVSLFSQVERVMAVTAADASPEEKVFAYTYMRAMQNCFANSRLYNLNSIPIENANKGEWFTTAPAREKDGYPLATGAAKSCADTDFVKKYMSIFGYPTGVDALGDNGLKMTRNSESEFTEDGKAVASRLPATVAAKWGTTPAIDAALDYVLLKSVLGADAGCRASATSDRTLASGSKGAVTKTVSGDGEVVETLYYWGTDVDDDTKRTVANTPSYGKDERTCQKIADDMSASAAAYVNTFPVQSCDVKYKGNDAQINACKDGEKHPDESTYCQTTYPNGPSEPGTQQACLYGQKRAAFDPGGINGDDGENVTSCQIEAIGWIVCPVVRFLAKTTDASYSIIRRMMTVPSSILDTSNANSVYQPWQTMRNLANISFITVFLFIIYSHLTSAGISNYTLKKMLPKLIVGALLVNLSFWICGGLVELSNVIGENIYKVVGTAADSMYPPDVIANTSPDAGVWNGLTTAVLMGTGIAGVAAFSSFAILIPLLLSAALAIVTVLVVLTVRQALIVVMVMIAPLAFVAYMLPNTEGLFKKWWGLFKSLLLLYPVVSMVFAGSALASLVLTAASNSPEGPASGDLPGFTLSVMGAAVSILPLFITPILMKTTSGVLGQVTGMVNNKNRGMIDRSKKFAGEKHQEKYNNALANGAPNRFGRGGRWNPLNRAASRLQRNRYNSINRKSSIAASNAQLEADALAEPEGQDAAKRNITAQKTSSVNQNAAKQAWLENHDNEALELQAEVSELNVKKAEAEAKLRLQGEAEFTAAQTQATLAEDELKSAQTGQQADIESLRATGGVINRPDGTTVVDSELLERTGATTDTADRLRVADQGTQISQMTAEAAKREGLSRLTETLSKDEDTLARAAGVEADGVVKLKAKVKAAQSQEMMTNIANIQSTMDKNDASNNEWLAKKFDDSTSLEEKTAYLRQMVRNGSDGVKTASAVLETYTKGIDPESAQGKDIKNLKDLMASDDVFMKAGRNFEVWANNEYSYKNSATGKNEIHPDFESVTKDTEVWGDISAQRFASMSKPAQMEALEVLDGTPDLEKLVGRIIADSTAMGNIKGKPQERINEIVSRMTPPQTQQSPGVTSPDGRPFTPDPDSSLYVPRS